MPLQARPYKGPYKMLQKGPKCFTLEIEGKAVTVDHLKLHTVPYQVSSHAAGGTGAY